MDVITEQALQSLRGALGALLPAPADPALPPALTVLPVKVSPTGLGGFAGLHPAPHGPILGRRISALASFVLRGADEQSLGANVAAVTDALLGADRALLHGQGIYRLHLDELGPVSNEGSGGNAVARRDASFSVLYEFLKLPDAASGVIAEIPVDIDLAGGGANPELLFAQSLDDPSVLDLFDIVDDPQATQFGPSDWQFDAPGHRIAQRSNIRGGGLTATPTKAGTMLVLISDSTRPAVRDFLLKTTFETPDPDGIGLVFRWQDVDNFYYCLLSNRHGYRLLGKKTGGTFAALTTPGLDERGAHALDTVHELKVIALGSSLQVYLDDELAVTGEDTDIDAAGRVGLLCHANDAAFFYQLKLVRFSGV